jgi:hypothetical protein
MHSYLILYSAWVDKCQSAIVNENREQAHVLFVIPASSILGHLPFVPVGTTRTGTVPFDMRGELADSPGAACNKNKGRW